eukprot:COSAG01_NODE_3330_length_6246_cov_4.593298_1_plen_57_part_00
MKQEEVEQQLSKRRKLEERAAGRWAGRVQVPSGRQGFSTGMGVKVGFVSVSFLTNN